jgi:endonuclease YncB( thermonuclease family)
MTDEDSLECLPHRYRHEVGRIYLSDRFINLEMVRDGFAGTMCGSTRPANSLALSARPE